MKLGGPLSASMHRTMTASVPRKITTVGGHKVVGFGKGLTAARAYHRQRRGTTPDPILVFGLAWLGAKIVLDEAGDAKWSVSIVDMGNHDSK